MDASFSLHEDDDDDGEKNEIMTSTTASFSGVEAFLVGISPSYWAHVPMSIAQVHNLQLVDGIHCMTVYDNTSDNDNNNNDTVNKDSSYPLAVSKCLLMGMVVIVERRPGSIIFVLDDGTGLMDCLLWTDRDIFELPSLTGERNIQSEQKQQQPYVGQMVRVHGRIEAVSVQDVGSVGDTGTPASTALDDSLVVGKRRNHCIREIHVTLLEPIPVTSQAQPHSLNAESLHWLDYCRRFGSCSTSVNDSHCTDTSTTTNTTTPATMLNAAQVLDRFLGPEIAHQVARRESLPSAHDKEASWKLFGVACRCTLKYKAELLYCHCLATNLSDELDPGLVYRDALLYRLLELQQEQQHQRQQFNNGDNDTNIKKPNEPLQFHYKTVATDNQLMAVLDSMDMSTTATTTTSSSISQQQQQQQHRRRRVVQKTFAALRKDGILALLCDKSDVYLLISRTFVLEPYIQTTMAKANTTGATNNKSTTSHQLPDYLSNVPRARLQYVRRTMSNGS